MSGHGRLVIFSPRHNTAIFAWSVFAMWPISRERGVGRDFLWPSSFDGAHRPSRDRNKTLPSPPARERARNVVNIRVMRGGSSSFENISFLSASVVCRVLRIEASRLSTKDKRAEACNIGTIHWPYLGSCACQRPDHSSGNIESGN